MTPAHWVLGTLLVVGMPALVQAADPHAGRRKAQQCAACHGPDGIARLPEAPHLAGQPASYLRKALEEYRSGLRRHETMSVAARQIKPEDIDDIVAWYASVEIQATPPALR